MTKSFTVNLLITLEKMGGNTSAIIETYIVNMASDINETAWNLCNCDNSIQAERFGLLSTERLAVSQLTSEDFQIDASFQVIGENPAFVKGIIEELMDGFPDCIEVTLIGYYARNRQSSA